MRNVPDYLYIGTSKAGSTWLFRTLKWHPQIYAYPGKNLGFFSTRFENGWDWYLSNFKPEPQHKAVGEISHSYLASDKAPARIKDLLPDVKMIVTLRDPVERTFSDYLDRVKNGGMTGTFEEELARDPGLVNRSRYGTQLSRYLELFDRDQIHISVFDDLAANPNAFASGIFEFLGVDVLPLPAKIENKVLPAGTPRNRTVAGGAKALSTLARRLGLNWLRGKVKTSRAVRNILYRPYGDDKPTIKPETAAQLRETFRSELELLDKVAGTNLAARWSH
jgi:hypothetical protein